MNEKNYIVTGASRGIGRAVAVRLLEQGHKVVLVAKSEKKLRELERTYPGKAIVYAMDVTNYEEVDRMFKECLDKGLTFDGLVYCAGVGEDCPIKSVDMKTMQRTFDVNYFGYVNMAKKFTFRKYANNGASIVAMSSTASTAVAMGMCEYASTKISINVFTQIMAKEVAKKRIRVNAVAPAMVDTDMYYETLNRVEGYEEKMKKSQPFGVIPVEQIVYLVDFLLSDSASYITGAVIPVSGGVF